MSVYEIPPSLNEEALRDRAIRAVAERVEDDHFVQGIIISCAELTMTGIAAANGAISNIKSRLTH